MKLHTSFHMIHHSCKKTKSDGKLTILPSLLASASFWSQDSLVAMRCTFPPANSTFFSESSSSVWGCKHYEHHHFLVEWLKVKMKYIENNMQITIMTLRLWQITMIARTMYVNRVFGPAVDTYNWPAISQSINGHQPPCTASRILSFLGEIIRWLLSYQLFHELHFSLNIILIVAILKSLWSVSYKIHQSMYKVSDADRKCCNH